MVWSGSKLQGVSSDGESISWKTSRVQLFHYHLVTSELREVEARYVGSRHVDDWGRSNINEINIVENGFIGEFRKAQANLQANMAAGRGATRRCWYGYTRSA